MVRQQPAVFLRRDNKIDVRTDGRGPGNRLSAGRGQEVRNFGKVFGAHSWLKKVTEDFAVRTAVHDRCEAALCTVATAGTSGKHIEEGSEVLRSQGLLQTPHREEVGERRAPAASRVRGNVDGKVVRRVGHHWETVGNVLYRFGEEWSEVRTQEVWAGAERVPGPSHRGEERRVSYGV